MELIYQPPRQHSGRPAQLGIARPYYKYIYLEGELEPSKEFMDGFKQAVINKELYYEGLQIKCPLFVPGSYLC